MRQMSRTPRGRSALLLIALSALGCASTGSQEVGAGADAGSASAAESDSATMRARTSLGLSTPQT